MISLLLIVGGTVFLTSAISGVLGMAGGMILMAVYTMLFPVEIAMVFHGFTQFLANGQRVVVWRKHLFWKILGAYSIGSILALGLFRIYSFVPDKALVYLCLGLFPFIGFLKKTIRHLDIRKSWVSGLCGILVTGAQLISGASGPILDIFYVHSSLQRHAVIANKALTQTLGHALKLAYYLSLILALKQTLLWDELRGLSYLVPLMALASFGGTQVGTKILEHVDEKRFRQTSQFVILLIGFFFLYRAYSIW